MSGYTGTWGELLYKNAATGVQGAVNTTEAQLNTNATMGPQPILPAGFFLPQPQSVGKAIRVVARGVLSTTTGPPTLGLLVRGSTTPNVITGPVWLGTTSTITVAVSQTGIYWELEGIVTASVVGSATNSTIRGFGRALSGAFGQAAAPYNNTAIMWGGQASPGTVTTVDFTVAQYLTVSYVSSSASNSCSLNELEVYGLN